MFIVYWNCMYACSLVHHHFLGEDLNHLMWNFDFYEVFALNQCSLPTTPTPLFSKLTPLHVCLSKQPLRCHSGSCFFFCSHRAEKISGQEESLSCLQLIVRHPFFEAFFGVATWQVLLRSNCCVWSFLCVCVCATLDPVVGVYSIQNIHIVFSGTCLAW